MSSTTVVFSSAGTVERSQPSTTRKDFGQERDLVAPKTYSVTSSSLVQRSIKNIKVKIDDEKLKKAVKE